MHCKSSSEKVQETPTRWMFVDALAVCRNEMYWHFRFCQPANKKKKKLAVPHLFWGRPWRRTRWCWTTWLQNGTEVTAGREVVEPRASEALSPGWPGRCPRCWSPTAYPLEGRHRFSPGGSLNHSGAVPTLCPGLCRWVQGSLGYLLMTTNDFIIYSLYVLYRGVRRSNLCIVSTYCDRCRCQCRLYLLFSICPFNVL